MRLITPTLDYREAFHALVLSFRENQEADLFQKYRRGGDDFENYIRDLQNESKGINLKPDHVTQSHFWLEDTGRIVGVSRVRHFLNDLLLQEGGHIGYDIGALSRGQGFGTLILELTLVEAKKLGLKRALLTCDEDNLASKRVIEKNGGIFESKGTARLSKKQVLRYWINIE
jgi:predicted acetyltransferase